MSGSAAPPDATPPTFTDRLTRTLSLTPEDRRNLIELAFIFVALVAAMYVTGYIAWKTWGVADGSPTSLMHSIFDRWDVLNYEIIAQYGYDVSNYHASWFPAMPLVMRGGHAIGLSYWLAASIVVLVCAAGLTYVFYRLVRLDFAPDTAREATILLLISPSSFFLFVPYTEAMFLLFAVASFYCARKRNWAAAAALAGVASGVRSAGMFLLPALAIEYFASLDWQWRRVKPDIAWLALAPAGLAAYMVYSEIELHDALAFYHSLDRVPHAESLPVRHGFPDFIRSLVDDVRTIIISHSVNEIYASVAGVITLGLFGLAFLGMLYYRLPNSYTFFSACAALSSLPTGRLESVNRYALAAFPMFIVLALGLKRWPMARTPVIVASLALFFLGTVRFATFEWAG